jgi:hypothetical protein
MSGDLMRAIAEAFARMARNAHFEKIMLTHDANRSKP